MGAERVFIGKANVIQSPLTDGTDHEEELYRVDGFWGDRLELRVTGEDGDHYVRVGPGISRLQGASLTDTNSDGRVDVEYSHKTTRGGGKGGGSHTIIHHHVITNDGLQAQVQRFLARGAGGNVNDASR